MRFFLFVSMLRAAQIHNLFILACYEFLKACLLYGVLFQQDSRVDIALLCSIALHTPELSKFYCHLDFHVIFFYFDQQISNHQKWRKIQVGTYLVMFG